MEWVRKQAPAAGSLRYLIQEPESPLLLRCSIDKLQGFGLLGRARWGRSRDQTHIFIIGPRRKRRRCVRCRDGFGLRHFLESLDCAGRLCLARQTSLRGLDGIRGHPARHRSSAFRRPKNSLPPGMILPRTCACRQDQYRQPNQSRAPAAILLQALGYPVSLSLPLPHRCPVDTIVRETPTRRKVGPRQSNWRRAVASIAPQVANRQPTLLRRINGASVACSLSSGGGGAPPAMAGTRLVSHGRGPTPAARARSRFFCSACSQIPIEKKEQDDQEDANGTGKVPLIDEHNLRPYSPILAAIGIT